MKLLFVDACIRGEKSRTKALCEHFIKEFTELNREAEVERVCINELDVEGFDAMYKIAILANIVFGKRIDVNKIYREGISTTMSDKYTYHREPSPVFFLMY